MTSIKNMYSSASKFLVCILGLLLILFHTNAPVQPESIQRTKSTVPLDLSRFQDCTVSREAPPANWTDRKTLFVPTIPGLGTDEILKNVISELTGIPTSFRSYYAQGGGFRRCQPNVVACSVGHPIISLGSLDNQRYDRFNDHVILPIRNPKYVVPAHFNMKANKYHDVQGQMEEDDWREGRDAWLSTVLGEWRNTLIEWGLEHRFKIAAYAPYEHLLDVNKGPLVVERIANVLQENGYSSLTGDYECIWYKSVGAARLQQFHRYGYEFEDYDPGYTREQVTEILDSISNMTTMFAEDQVFQSIMNEYTMNVKEHTRIDRPWVNKTVR